MNLLAVVSALLLQRYQDFPGRDRLRGWFAEFAGYLRHALDGGTSAHGLFAWLAAVLPVLIIVEAFYVLLHQASVVLAWAANTAVLFCLLEFKPLVDRVGRLHQMLRQGQLEQARDQLAAWECQVDPDADVNMMARLAIEQGLLRFHRRVVALLFWFALVPGPGGALLYWMAYQLWQIWGADGTRSDGFPGFATRAFFWIDWLPRHLTAFGFAVVGNFEDAAYCWRGQARTWPVPTEGPVLSSGAGALGVRLGDPVSAGGATRFRPELGLGDPADADYVQSAEGMIWRALLLWLAVLAVITLAAWVGE